MRKEDFFEVLGDIDEDIVRDAMKSVKEKSNWKVWGTIAACLALAVIALPIYKALKPGAPAVHGYVSVGNGAGTFEYAIVTDTGGTDMDPDTNELPGGAYIGNEADAAAQEEGMRAYQNLMAYFAENYGVDQYPEWYGGGYLESSGHLTINVVLSETNGADDKKLYLQIMEWAGSQQVVFADVKYSLTFLRGLQKQVESLPELAALSSWGCGINEESGQVMLTIPQADEALLIALAKLDPEDDAILVQVEEGFSVEYVPTNTVDALPGDLDGDPAGYSVPARSE